MRPIVFGMVLGAGAALLCAPVSGKTARSALRRNVRRLTRYTNDFVQQRRQHFDRALHDVESGARRIPETLDESTMEAVAGR